MDLGNELESVGIIDATPTAWDVEWECPHCGNENQDNISEDDMTVRCPHCHHSYEAEIEGVAW